MLDRERKRMSNEKSPSNLILLSGFRSEQSEATPPLPNDITPSTAPPLEEDLPGAIEALLFAADQPLRIEAINKYLNNPGLRLLRKALRRLQKLWLEERRGVEIKQIGPTWQLLTSQDYSHWVSNMHAGTTPHLSKAALETLSIIAYRQPIIRSEVDEYRGVESSGVIRQLIDNRLVEVVGQHPQKNRARMLGTTQQFLELFNLRDLAELPTLRDLDDISINPFADS